MSANNIFLDTNVLIYVLSDDEPKREVAISLIKNNPHISIQVLNEFCNVCKKKMGFSYPEIQNIILQLLPQIQLVQLHKSTILKALDIGDSYKYSYYDSLILASAIEANCNIVYSEDFQHNQKINNSLLVLNPFRCLI